MPAKLWTPEQMPPQTGKVVVITGANSGIGLQAARYFAKADATVILACRDLAKAEAARHAVLHWVMDARVEVGPLDLSNLDSVYTFANDYLADGRPLDLLINNAGVMALPKRQLTADGFEMQFGVNHLGHFALTGLMLPALLSAPTGRVVTVSSIAHRGGQIHFDNLNWQRDYRPWPAYRQSKLANLLFGFELERRLRRARTSASSVVVHPGVASTNLFVNGPGQSKGIVGRLAPWVISRVGQPEREGSFPTLYGATDPNARGGHFYGPDGFREMRGNPTEVEPEAQAKDPALAARLWAVSEQLTGVRYPALDGY